MIERTCPTCDASHKTIVYKRLTVPGTIDFKNLFLNQVEKSLVRIYLYVYLLKSVDSSLMLRQWYSKPEGGSNVLNIDFALYDNKIDAQVVPPNSCFLKISIS